MTLPIDQAAPVRLGEELDVARLQRFLADHLGDGEQPLQVRQFPRGYSNLSYLLNLGPRELVLRRPPFGNPVKSAHDMGREYRVLSKLCEVYELAPRPHLFCDDPSVLGDEFYIMEYRRGVVLRGADPLAALRNDPALVRGLSEAFVDNLARLHTLDYREAGLGDLGKPTGYVERQVSGWTERYRNAQTEAVPDIDAIADWLAEHRPAERGAALIHNDYKYDNLSLDPDDLTRIRAVFDWEMSTVADPLMDLGSTLAYWVEPNDAQELREYAFGPTMAAGSLTRRELVDRYAERTGFEVPDVLFYYCYGLFKLAVIVQQIHARYVRGHTRDERFATLNRKVAVLGAEAVRAVSTERL